MRTIAGRYRVIGQLGQGGMGAVLEVEHTGLPGRRLAVKVLKPEHRTDDQLLERLRREARAASSIDHPGIVQVLDIEEDRELGPILVMERLQGETVSARAKRGSLSSDETRWVVLQTLGCLAAAHDAGVVHRDIKPSNLFLEETPGGPRLRLLDFGIATTRGSDLTRPGEFIGTLRFASPEQILAEPIGPPSDLYSLASTALTLLGGSWSIRRSLAGDEADLPDIDPTWREVLERSLHPNPSGRYSSAAEMSLALQALSGTASPPGTDLQETGEFDAQAFYEMYGTVHTTGQTTFESLPATTTRTSRRAWLALPALALVGGGAWAWSRDVDLGPLCRGLTRNLLANQRPDGGFAGLAQVEAGAWDTAQQTAVLKRASCADVPPDALDRAMARLEVWRTEQGWPMGADVPSSVPTAWALLAGAPQAEDLLQSFRNDDGGFAMFSGTVSHAYATALAAWALGDLGARRWLETNRSRSTTVPGLDEQVSWLLGDISVVDRIQERLEAEAYPDGEVDLTRPDGQYGVAVMLGLPWALRCTRELGLSGRIQRRLERRMLQRADGVLAGPLYAQAEVLLGLG